MILIIFVILMLFGSDKIPDIARTLGRGMQQLKNASNEIKSEIHKSADLDGVKRTITDVTADVRPDDISAGITKEIDKVKEDIEDMSGPIKRMH